MQINPKNRGNNQIKKNKTPSNSNSCKSKVNQNNKLPVNNVEKKSIGVTPHPNKKNSSRLAKTTKTNKATKIQERSKTTKTTLKYKTSKKYKISKTNK